MLDDRAEARIVRDERRVDRVLARRRPRQTLEGRRVSRVAKRRPRDVETALAEKRRRRRPGGAVPVAPVRPGLRAEREERGEVARRP